MEPNFSKSLGAEHPLGRDALIMKDYHLGLLAQVTEMNHRVADLESRLLNEMTRAYNAETSLADTKRQITRLNSLERQLKELHESTTWRVGRLIMLPIRILRRILD